MSATRENAVVQSQLMGSSGIYFVFTFTLYCPFILLRNTRPMTFTNSLMDPHSILRSRIPLTELTWLADGQPERNLQIKCAIIASQYISAQQQKQQTCLKQHVFKKTLRPERTLLLSICLKLCNEMRTRLITII